MVLTWPFYGGGGHLSFLVEICMGFSDNKRFNTLGWSKAVFVVVIVVFFLIHEVTKYVISCKIYKVSMKYLIGKVGGLKNCPIWRIIEFKSINNNKGHSSGLVWRYFQEDIKNRNIIKNCIQRNFSPKTFLEIVSLNIPQFFRITSWTLIEYFEQKIHKYFFKDYLNDLNAAKIKRILNKNKYLRPEVDFYTFHLGISTSHPIPKWEEHDFEQQDFDLKIIYLFGFLVFWNQC